VGEVPIVVKSNGEKGEPGGPERAPKVVWGKGGGADTDGPIRATPNAKGAVREELDWGEMAPAQDTSFQNGVCRRTKRWDRGGKASQDRRSEKQHGDKAALGLKRRKKRLQEGR